MITFVRNVLGGVLTVIDLAVKSEAMGRAYSACAASSWLDRQEEASEVLEPRSFVCNTRAEIPDSLRIGLQEFAEGKSVSSDWLFECDDDPMVSDSLLRYNDIECDICATEHADFPGAPIACGTPGCPNFSEPSAPGASGTPVERTGPDAVPPRLASGPLTSPDVAAGSQQRANVVGGVASADDLLPGGGTGQPLDREAHEALHEAAGELELRAKSSSWQDRIRLIALAAEIRDLAHQFEADTN